MLNMNMKGEGMSMGVFSEDIYDRVKKLVEVCLEKAIIIEKIK